MRWRTARHARDRGSAEAALSLATTLTLMLLVVQVAIWAHGHHRAHAIAEQVLAATRGVEASETHGHARADEVVASLGGELLRHTEVDITRTPTQASVQVSAAVPSLVPGWQPQVSASLAAPVERLEVTP